MASPDRIRRKRLQREAEGYLELGLTQRALQTLHRIGDPESFGAHLLYLMGEALRGLDRYEEALFPLERAAEGDPRNIHIWLAIGWCQKRIGHVDLAIEALEEALRHEPGEAILHYNLACYLSLVGDKERALRKLSKALVIDPNYRELVDEEPDFDSIRDDPEFQALTSIIV